MTKFLNLFRRRWQVIAEDTRSFQIVYQDSHHHYTRGHAVRKCVFMNSRRTPDERHIRWVAADRFPYRGHGAY